MRIADAVAIVFVAQLLAGCGSGDGTSPPPGGGGTGTISGSVIDVDSGSAGLAGVAVQLTGTSGTQTVTTAAGGGFTLANAAPGAWQAQLQTPGTHRLDTGEAGTRSASVTANQTATLNPFRLTRPRGSVTGSVTLGGQGTASGNIAASRPGFTGASAVPSVTGAFSISELAVGPWTVTYTPGTGHQLSAGETGTRSVTVAENQAASVTAFLIDEAPPGPQIVEIHLTGGAQFVPSSVTIAPGTTVRWINDSAETHTITPETPTQQGVWERRETSTAGVVFEHTFLTPNQTYRYRCEPHSTDFTSGMVGVIVVTS